MSTYDTGVALACQLTESLTTPVPHFNQPHIYDVSAEVVRVRSGAEVAFVSLGEALNVFPVTRSDPRMALLELRRLGNTIADQASDLLSQLEEAARAADEVPF